MTTERFVIVLLNESQTVSETFDSTDYERVDGLDADQYDPVRGMLLDIEKVIRRKFPRTLN